MAEAVDAFASRHWAIRCTSMRRIAGRCDSVNACAATWRREPGHAALDGRRRERCSASSRSSSAPVTTDAATAVRGVDRLIAVESSRSGIAVCGCSSRSVDSLICHDCSRELRRRWWRRWGRRWWRRARIPSGCARFVRHGGSMPRAARDGRADVALREGPAHRRRARARPASASKAPRAIRRRARSSRCKSRAASPFPHWRSAIQSSAVSLPAARSTAGAISSTGRSGMASPGLPPALPTSVTGALAAAATFTQITAGRACLRLDHRWPRACCARYRLSARRWRRPRRQLVDADRGGARTDVQGDHRRPRPHVRADDGWRGSVLR